MSVYLQGGAEIHYEESGDPDGAPLLLIAPGGMRSSIDFWSRIDWSPQPVLQHRRLIAMDQRNAGKSTAPVTAEDGWSTYTADQLGLMDHLGVERFDVLGMCIGGPYIFGLMRAAPARIRSAVVFQPIGLDGNRPAFFELFDGWAAELAPNHPEADATTWAAFREAMFGGDFLPNTGRDEIPTFEPPLLLFMGDDHYHPQSTSRELARLYRNVTFVETWKTAPSATEAQLVDFLADPG